MDAFKLQSYSKNAHGPWSDLALHTIGWRAFQDLCSQICEVVLNRPFEIYHEVKDGGQDAVFLTASSIQESENGTLQCKHTSNANKTLNLSDISPEFLKIERLVKQGQAHSYIFMTNMSVNATIAIEIKNELKMLGVKKPYIFGRQFIIRTIKHSPKLRATVPQVYGLGDLTSILDQSVIEQSRALLDDYIPKLKTYVPTLAHKNAINSITNNKIVLLLGNPASGKTMIGKALSLLAIENGETVIELTSPIDFKNNWNPNESRRFYWIDDAFGSNVLQDDYINDWTQTFPKINTAINRNCRFLFTSRKHIYEEAKKKLGSRNFDKFRNGSAVVDVGELTAKERQQILYNHIKHGNQNKIWRQRVKPHLNTIAAADGFLPGVVERLGNSEFTKALNLNQESLVNFMKKPIDHLKEVINSLDEKLIATLILVYAHKSDYNQIEYNNLTTNEIVKITNVNITQILNGLDTLNGSFLKKND